MKTLLDVIVNIENRINRLRTIHYLLNKEYDSLSKIPKEALELVETFCGNEKELKYLKLKLALVCEDIITINALKDIAKEFGIIGTYKMTKVQLLERLKKIP